MYKIMNSSTFQFGFSVHSDQMFLYVKTLAAGLGFAIGWTSSGCLTTTKRQLFIPSENVSQAEIVLYSKPSIPTETVTKVKIPILLRISSNNSCDLL